MKLAKTLLITLAGVTLTNYAIANLACQKFENIATKSHTQKITTENYQPTDPDMVKVGYMPVSPYQEIGRIYVSLYNVWGIKRQSGVISDLMQVRAAKIGGDDICNIHVVGHYAVGDIIKLGTMESST